MPADYLPTDQVTVLADPGPFGFNPARTALLLIDMQRDFVEPGGFGETLGNDVSLLQAVIPPLRQVLAATRAAGMTVIHTREGHPPTWPTAHRPSSTAAVRRCGSATSAPGAGS
jgi:nicotinamidase-related amidase